MKVRKESIRWMAALACATVLAACGGGGGTTDTGSTGTTGSTGSTDTTPPSTPAVPDARNGDYVMYAGDARQYTLSLDFDAKTYHLVGNSQDLTGTMRESNTSGKFDLDVAGTATPAPNAPKFTWFNDTVLGGFRLPSGTVPFIAARSFVTTLSDAAGTYNFLASIRDTAGPSNSMIFTGELLAGGTLRTCMDNGIYTMSSCPTTSVATAIVTPSGDHFLADTGTGTYSFRVAKVGTERVFLRASASSGTTRRLQVGMPETTFTNGDFAGVNTHGDSTATSFTATAYNANWNDGTANFIRLGTVGTLGGGPAGIVGITAGADGNFFAMHDSELMVLVAARDNPVWPGYVEFGKK
jgi:hypothetical protein